MNPELEELYQEVILDHSRRPRNFGELAERGLCVCTAIIRPAATRSISAVKFGPMAAWQEIKFSGHGCAISQASASMMTMKLKGKESQTEAMEMCAPFASLVTERNEQSRRSLGDLRLLRACENFRSE